MDGFATGKAVSLPDDLDERDLRAAQALADVATIGILHARTLSDSDMLRLQLQHALDSRVVIEQAKGFVAHKKNVTPEEAFRLIRSYARSHSQRLSDVARGIVEQRLSL
jgi:hypothetical protein